MKNDPPSLQSHRLLQKQRRRFLKNTAQAAISSGVLSLLPHVAKGQSAIGSAEEPGGTPVKLREEEHTFLLSNGLLEVTIAKDAPSILAMRYKGLDLLGEGSLSNGYWSMPGTHYTFGKQRSITILHDPSKNGGERATISCKFSYDGTDRCVPADVEFLYSLGRDHQAIYLQALWAHKSSYPKLSFPVGRFAAKLNDSIFDWMTVDARRNLKMITAYDWNHGTRLNLKEARRMNTGIRKGQVEHKYDYCAVQFETPAYGWSSTTHNVGIWMVTAHSEYMSGGATKLELTTHRDATFTDSLTAPAAPVLLNVWKGPHYGGTSLEVAEGEEWSKSVGPFLLYCNSGPTPDAMWKDAVAQAKRQARRWPFPWATGSLYPGRKDRATVRGRLLLRDPLLSGSSMRNLRVGLTHPDYTLPDGDTIDWQRDGKFYQFWVRGDSRGHFNIPHVRPGTYTLHAIADGVLGEYVKTDIQVEGGRIHDLGSLPWRPLRYGKQLWEIGTPTRTAGEFLHGDHYWRWGIYNQYPKDFPHDVHFVVGKSDSRKDWNIMQVPRAHDESGRGRGDATSWSVSFDLPRPGHGRATLRLAFAGTEARSLEVAVNGQAVAMLTGFRNTSAIHRDADRSYWTQRDVPFDGALLHSGRNTLTLTIPSAGVMQGIEYDYLRLELDEDAAPPTSS